jgi:hypothetical protein
MVTDRKFINGITAKSSVKINKQVCYFSSVFENKSPRKKGDFPVTE